MSVLCALHYKCLFYVFYTINVCAMCFTLKMSVLCVLHYKCLCYVFYTINVCSMCLYLYMIVDRVKQILKCKRTCVSCCMQTDVKIKLT